MIDPTLAIFGFTALLAHDVADHILQTSKVSTEKVGPGLRGWLYGLRHGLDHLVLTVIFLLVAAWATGMPLELAALTVSVGLIVGSHIFIDRRWPTRWVLRHTGSADFAEQTTPVCGMYLADQALHRLPLFVGSAIYAIMTTH